MKYWLIKKTPKWVLRYLVWRNNRLREAGRLPDKWYWADLELWSRNDFSVEWDIIYKEDVR